MNTIGHNFIAGSRSAEGDKILKSLNATTGEALDFDFHGMKAEIGDEFEIEMKEFGQPLVNRLAPTQPELPIGSVITL